MYYKNISESMLVLVNILCIVWISSKVYVYMMMSIDCGTVTGPYMGGGGAGNGSHKGSLHPAAYPMPRVPLPPYHGGPQPYAIPTRGGGVHGPVGAVPHVPQPGSRGFTAGRGNAGGPIGSHLSHQHQQQQQPIGGSNFNNFPSLENPTSQSSVAGGPLSQPGYVSNVSILLPNILSHLKRLSSPALPLLDFVG